MGGGNKKQLPSTENKLQGKYLFANSETKFEII